MAAPDGPVNLHMLYEKMGEVGAIAREAKHAANNASTKIDALALIVAEHGILRSHVERLERDIEDQSKEVETLKADKLRRDGAIGLVEWISKHWPFLLAIIGMGIWVAFANGMMRK